MKTIRGMIVGVMLISLVGRSGAFAFNDGGACYYKTFQEGQFVECGDDGCLYPDGTNMTPDGYFDADGNEMTDDLISPDELFGTDKSVCLAKDGSVLGDESFDGKTLDELMEGLEDPKDKAPSGFDPEHFGPDAENYDSEAHMAKFDMSSEILSLEEELSSAAAVFDAVSGVDDKKIIKTASELDELTGRGMALLTKMKSVIVDGKVSDEKVIHDAWDMLDGVAEEAMGHIRVLLKYFEENPAIYDALSDVQKSHISGWKKGPGKGPKFDEIYEGFGMKGPKKAALMKQIKDEAMSKVMREVEGQLMSELSNYLDDEIVAGILNNIDYFGKDSLKNIVGVYEKIDSSDDLDENFKRLGRMTKEMIISEEVAGELESKWGEVEAAFAADNRDALDKLKGEIEDLLIRNKEIIYRSDDAVMFEDLGLDHWSAEYVFELKKEGVIDGYRDKKGKLKGKFGPADDVTIAELLKMGMESSGRGIDAVKGEGSHWAETSGYVDLAKEFGIDKLVDIGNLNRPATREEAAVMIAALFDYDVDVKWENPFDDYHGKYEGYVQAVYDEGVFTGNGETGEFMGDKHLNRAEVAKVIRIASKELGFEEDMDEFFEVLERL